MSNLLLKRFLKNPGRIGAVMPSGHALCHMMLADLDLEHSGAIAELGPGTGVFTRAILSHIGAGTRFFAVELDPVIYRELCRKMPEVSIYNDNAARLDKICAEHDVGALDAVISGLPWAAFPAELQESILGAVLRALKPGGKFVTFAYLQGMPLPAGRRFRKMLEKHFASVVLSPVVWNNFPPAVVYRCGKTGSAEAMQVQKGGKDNGCEND